VPRDNIHAKKSLVQFQSFSKNITIDLNSLEGTRFANTLAVRPEGSLVTYHCNPNKFSKFNNSIYNFIVEAEK
jgi:hypothetical protein